MATLAKPQLETSAIAPLIGTTILNDKVTLLRGDLAGEIRETLEARGVLIFPKIGFTDKEQVAFTRTLGIVNDEGEDGIFKVTMDEKENAHRDYLRGAFYWHFDGFSSPKPILASLLSAHALPDDGSGDTEFCNTYAAYDALSDEEKAAFETIRVIHTFEETTRYWCPEPSYEQLQAWQGMGQFDLPLVWTHRSGRKSLVLGCSAAWVVGMAPFESKALLTRLRAWATQPRFVYRHQWSVGDLVIWDNTGTMHHAMPYDFDSGRMMHRTKLEGEESLA